MLAVTVRIFASHPVAASHYARLLASEKDFRLTDDDRRFQVGIFDSELDTLEGALTLARLKFPSMRPLLLSKPCDDNECLRWALRGVWGLVAYDRYEKELAQAVRQLAAGQLWFPPAVILRCKELDAARRASVHRLPLTRREREVLDFLTRRLSNKEIAGILKISERTVKFHVGNILGKLHLSSRQELSTVWVPSTGLM